jgi:hypothetical protein
MKRAIKTAAIILFAATVSANGQFFRSVHGNGRVIEKERSLPGFTGLKVSSGLDVCLKQGEKESVMVEADENLHEYILTEVKNNVLNVYSEVNIRDADKTRICVTMKDITSIKATSAGDIKGETPVKTDRLLISASSAGDIRLEIYAREVNADISSSGDMTLSGETGFLKANLSSAGDLNAYDLKAKEADVSVSSAGDAHINVEEKLVARASSAGDIHYQGNPRYIDAHSSSAGGIHKK